MTRMMFLPLLNLALVQCGSVDEVPARSPDGNLFEDDSALRCNVEEAPDQTYDASGWNRMLYLNEELRQASGMSRITNCEEAKVFGRAFLKYVQDHPEFVKVMNERIAPARRLHDQTAPPQAPPTRALDEEKP